MVSCWMVCCVAIHMLMLCFEGGPGGKLDDIVKRKALEVSMSRSDTGFTTWSKLKKNSSQSQLQRYVRK